MAAALENARLFEEARRLATIDTLTEIYNRSHFFLRAQAEFNRARRLGEPMAAMMIDIDHFKRVNDTYGHLVGDQVLRVIAGLCNKRMRKYDLLGRYGGEEFVVILPHTTIAQALTTAERIRENISQTEIKTTESTINVRVSIGVAALTKKMETLESLLDQADRALYQAKDTGRNRVARIMDNT